jgi:hypothetical protein
MNVRVCFSSLSSLFLMKRSNENNKRRLEFDLKASTSTTFNTRSTQLHDEEIRRRSIDNDTSNYISRLTRTEFVCVRFLTLI